MDENNNNRILLYYIINSLIILFAFGIFYVHYNQNKSDEKINLEDFNYYIGKVENGLPNGKGKKYDKDDILIYEGNFLNGKYEGIGHLNLGNDRYYYGNFKHGKYNGKGIIYRKFMDKTI